MKATAQLEREFRRGSLEFDQGENFVRLMRFMNTALIVLVSMILLWYLPHHSLRLLQVSNRGQFCPPPQWTFGNIWIIFDCHKLGSTTGIQQVEAKVATKHPTMHRSDANNKKIILFKMSIVLKLKNSTIDSELFPLSYLETLLCLCFK